jgi:hydroxyacyl-ACP dehydratase HTD2-like protein with hotdog domain
MNPTDWIGRTESRHGAVTPVLAGMLGGALGHAAAGPMPMDEGAALPPLWHWVAFPEFLPLSELGGDGHPRLGRFLPPVPAANPDGAQRGAFATRPGMLSGRRHRRTRRCHPGA